MDEFSTLDSNETSLIKSEFDRAFGESVVDISPLKQHASDRRLFRVVGQFSSAVAVFNPSRVENDTFSYLTNHFFQAGLPVPTIYSYHPERGFLLEADLGNTTLLDLLAEKRSEADPFPRVVERMYERALDFLARFQVFAGSSLDFSRCAVNQTSSERMFSKDILAFKEQFLSRAYEGEGYPDIADECKKLCEYVGGAAGSYFLYRDFQARNIMVTGDELVFIDYQGGTRGPLQYDVVSILYQASAQIPDESRQRLVGSYLRAIGKMITIDEPNFLDCFRAFIALRMMQVLSVYGKQGLGAGKKYFRDSIPMALATLAKVVASPDFPIPMPRLGEIAYALQIRFPCTGIASE